MTEKDWLACTDSDPMLEFMKGKTSDRKLRLFSCACLRRILDLLDDFQERVRKNKEFALESNEPFLARKAAEVAERFADGRTDIVELTGLFPSPDEDDDASSHAAGPNATWTAKATAYRTRWIANCCGPASYPLGATCLSPSKIELDREKLAQCQLLRCIFGNSLRPVVVDLAWLKPTVVKIAQQIYDDHSFDCIPMLANALEDTGCDSADILAHCRRPRPHVRGCWVVDTALGKE